MNICANCKHFRNLDPGSPRANVWYNHLCAASPRPERIDPVTGKQGYAGRNDLGGEYVTDQKYEYCRTINPTGDCQLYEPISTPPQDEEWPDIL